jgi:hypothetical protein
MAFKFPDPNVTPEFIGNNGITYSWDFDDAKWTVKTIKIQKSMKVIQTTGSISLGDKLPFKPYDSSLKMKKEKKESPDDPFSYLTPDAGFRWLGQNPETGRIIFYNDRWFGYTDDEGETWNPSTAMHMWNPGSGTSKNYLNLDGANKDQDHLFTWCGGKQWIAKTSNPFGYIIFTVDDFENIYNCRFNDENNGFDSKPWKSIKYDSVNDEIWTTWGSGKIVQFDSDLTKWLNTSNGGPYGDCTLKYSDGPDKGVLYKKQINLRHGNWSGTTHEYYFNDIGLSGHGTKIALTQWGIMVRTTDNFQTWEEINSSLVFNDPYYAKYSHGSTKNVVPGRDFNKARIQYIAETDVWIVTTKNSFQVSYDDGITWVEMDYKTRGTKEDSLFEPNTKGDYNSSQATPPNYRYFYYHPTGKNFNAGYLKGHYYYITQEVGDPKRNSPEYFTNLSDNQSWINYAWCLENVMYVTEDFKNWTRIPYGIDWGYENGNDGTHTPGTETAFISHQPGADRMFILSDGHYKQTPYRVNYIDGFK